MAYNENISLKIVNNTPADFPIELLSGNASDYSNTDLNNLVEWDCTAFDFSTLTTVTLQLSNPITKTALSNSIQGAVDTLNTMNVGTFSYSGKVIYATALLDTEVKIAKITLT